MAPVNIDFAGGLNILLVLLAILLWTAVGQLVRLRGLFFFGALYMHAFSYILSVMNVFRGLFDFFSFIPVIGVLLKDLPDILTLIFNNIGPFEMMGPYASPVYRFFLGALLGISAIDIVLILKRAIGAESLTAKLGLVLISIVLIMCALLITIYQVSDAGCAIIDSLCLLKQGIYIVIIPLAVFASFVANMAAFIFTLVEIFRSSGNMSVGEMLSSNIRSILAAVLIVSVFSVSVILPLIQPASSAAVNLW